MTVKSAPIIKWAGGKRSLLASIVSLFPKVDTYAEPFLGGGAVFFEMWNQKKLTNAVLSDSNKELMDMYRGVKSNPNEVIAYLKEHKNSPEDYYRVRSLDPSSLPLAERSARTIYLNRCGFNGLYRVNKKGLFNVPFGKYENPPICNSAAILAASEALQCATLFNGDFEEVTEFLNPRDGAYFDPPYVPLTETSFTSYTLGGFSYTDHLRLKDIAQSLKDRKIHVVLSNSDTPEVRGLYKGWDLTEVKVRRSINSNGAGRGKVGELLLQ